MTRYYLYIMAGLELDYTTRFYKLSNLPQFSREAASPQLSRVYVLKPEAMNVETKVIVGCTRLYGAALMVAFAYEVGLFEVIGDLITKLLTL